MSFNYHSDGITFVTSIFFYGGQQQPNTKLFCQTGKGFTFIAINTDFGSIMRPFTGIFNHSENGFFFELNDQINFGGPQTPSFSFTRIGLGVGNRFGVVALPTHPLANSQLIVFDALIIKEFYTNTLTIQNGIIKTWVKTKGGINPSPPNTHQIIINNGLIQSWDIISDGSRPIIENTHSISMKRGLIQQWN